jgi:hypothetical protein
MARFNLAKLGDQFDAVIRDSKNLSKAEADLTRQTRDAAEAMGAIAHAAAAAGQSPGARAAESTRASGAAIPGVDGGQLAAQISGAMKGSNVALNLGKEFDKVGGVIVTTFRRIDAAMKFPALDKALTLITTKLEAPLKAVVNVLSGASEKARQTARSLETSVPILREIAGSASAVSQRFERQYDVINMLAKAWGGVGDRVAKARAEMEIASNRGPRAGQRPGMGRALSLPKVQLPSADRILVGAANAADKLGAAFAKIGPPAAASFNFIKEAVRASGFAVNLFLLTPLKGLGGAITATAQGYLRLKNVISSIGDVAKKPFSALFGENGRISSGLAKATGHARSFRGGLAQSASTASRLGGVMQGVGRDIAVALGVFGLAYKAVDFFKGAIMGASALGETVSATKQTFGDAFGKVDAETDRLAKSFGFSKNEGLQAAKSFGAIAKGAGVAGDESASFANTFTKLAANLTSRENIPFAESAERLRSVLSGNAVPLRTFGALIDADDVKLEAARLGLVKFGEQLSHKSELMARASLVQRQLADADGDLERTADSAANQFRKAGGGIENFATRIGQLLLPAVNVGVTAFNELLATVIEVFETNLTTVTNWASYVTSAMDQVGMVTRNLGAFFQIAKLKVGEFTANTVAYLEMLPENFARVTDWLGRNWQTFLGDLVEGFGAAFYNVLENAKNFGTAIWEALKGNEFKFEFTPLLKGFRAMTEKFPELAHGPLISVQKEIDEIFGEIGQKEAKRAAELAKKTPDAKKPGPLASPGSSRFAEAAELGSKEAYTAITKFQGNTRGDGIKAVAKTSQQIANNTKAIADEAKKPKPAGGNIPVYSL